MREARDRRISKRPHKKAQRKRDNKSQKTKDAAKLKELNMIVQQQQNAQFRGESREEPGRADIAPELSMLADAPAPPKRDLEMPPNLLSNLEKM